jgi:hypothetical protein
MKNYRHIDTLQELLQKQRDNLSMDIPKQDRLYPEQINTQRSKKGATLRDFIDMVADLTDKILGKKYDITFDPDEGHTPNDVDKLKGHPRIIYKLVSRKPKLERKERPLDMFSDNGTAYQIWAQSFTCMIQFTVLAGTYDVADKAMTDFEDMLSKYAGYFKENGVSEILFEKQFTDENYDSYRQSISVRTLQYRVDIQRVKQLTDTTMQDLTPILHDNA